MTKDDFLSDLRLLAYNAVKFNGPNSDLGRTAVGLLTTAAELLSIEREKVGLMEEAVRYR